MAIGEEFLLHDAAADAGADGDIEAAFEAFGRTEDGFGQGRGVHIGIHGDGNLQGFRDLSFMCILFYTCKTEKTRVAGRRAGMLSNELITHY